MTNPQVAEPDDDHAEPVDEALPRDDGAPTTAEGIAGGIGPSGLLASVVAILALVAYGIMLHAMYGKVTEENEVAWARMHELFTGIETIAFAAAGFFFGREVNRARAEVAERRAEGESRRATQSERKAADATSKGREITRELKELTDAPDADAHAFAIGPDGAATDGRAARLRRLVDRAEAYFPTTPSRLVRRPER